MRLLPALLSAATMLAAGPALADAPRVVASVKPVHSLVAAVMEGVGTPDLIVRGGASPHTYTLRPSDARALENADAVFWIGEGLEGFLEKPLASLATKARVVELMDSPGMALIEAGDDDHGEHDDHGDHDGDHDRHAEDDEHGHGHDHGGVNPHLWLDPRNAQAIVAAVADTLSAVDPASAATYRANADAATARLKALDTELAAALAPVAGVPFVVFHDAYPYFTGRYGLNAVGSVAVDPERRPSARHLSELRARITALNAVCVFAEPQFEPKLVATVAEGTGARAGTLDPVGADLPDGPELYPALMRGMAASLAACLKG